jgi:glutamate racemase
MNGSAPIGVLDSGIGGLSVLREMRALLPDADLVYVADQAFAPYGERSLDEVRTRAAAVVSHLLDLSCAPIVIACNTASAAALHHLRQVHPDVPFVGMEPAVKPAAETTGAGVIGVLATPATFQSELYASVVDRHSNGVEVIAQPAPGLVELVEEGHLDAALPLLRGYLAPMIEAGVDRLVLGCTHYPFLIDQIRRILPEDVAIIDPAPAVARQVARVTGGGGSRKTTYLATRPTDAATVETRAIEFTVV